MAMEVLTEIKAAEEKARETRRVAAAAAKEAIKLAEQENSEIKDKELTEARRKSIVLVDDAQNAAKQELDAMQEERMKECENLKATAQKNLSRAADVCLERILK